MQAPGIQYLSDQKGKKTAVLIDLKRYGRIWEDVYDALIAEGRRHEPRVAWSQVKRRARVKRGGRG